MSGIICCACSILAISVLQCALIQWRNDLNTTQKKNESQQKSRPMVNLIARAPSHVSSSTSASPVNRSHGNQNPWNTIAEKEERSGVTWYRHRPIESFWLPLPWTILWKVACSASYSKWDDNHAWSSQEWKTDTWDVRTIVETRCNF